LGLIYPWCWWGGYQLALYEQGKKVASASELTRQHDLELQREKSKRYEVEEKLGETKRQLREAEANHRSKIDSLIADAQKKSRSATDANEAALRSLL
jgi:hypothetical protein